VRTTAALVGGDLNSTPESAVQAAVREAGLRDAWQSCAPTADERAGYTYSAAAPVKRIDYLYLIGSAACAGARVLESGASDHRPLVVAVRFAAAAPRP
jgi:endonuclease/exonuclease/phosphatase (EEP) superfamily protein YafD